MCVLAFGLLGRVLVQPAGMKWCVACRGGVFSLVSVVSAVTKLHLHSPRSFFPACTACLVLHNSAGPVPGAGAAAAGACTARLTQPLALFLACIMPSPCCALLHACGQWCCLPADGAYWLCCWPRCAEVPLCLWVAAVRAQRLAPSHAVPSLYWRTVDHKSPLAGVHLRALVCV